ncbi:MAG: 4-demethylwyosine synthase TYW1 [Nanoarchaeota archaeon]
MLTDAARKELEQQQYRVIGSHSAVKTCGWTRKMIKGEGGCYKLKFYGIRSSQCLQMTTSMSCANRCIFCWRDYKAPVAKEWKWTVDDPDLIFTESVKAHHKLLTGFGGLDSISKTAYNESKAVRHVALSLTGEPIIYPRINELIEIFNKNDISTFMVTNAQYPDQIKSLSPVTQLYISLDAPNKEMLKMVDLPLFPDYWERFLQSLDCVKEKKQRTTIRLTCIKNVNMTLPDQYAALIRRASPDFLEVKAYMFIGASRQRLTLDNMPYHEEVVAFTKELMIYLPEYDIVSEHLPSRVVMCAKRKFKKADGWHTWIDFEKFHDLAVSGKEFSTDDYLQKTPLTGLSGKGTMRRNDKKMPRIKAQAKETGTESDAGKDLVPFVDEQTDELELWKE